MKKKTVQKKKNPVAQALAALRHKSLSPARRKQIAAQAAQTRWKKKTVKNPKGT